MARLIFPSNIENNKISHLGRTIKKELSKTPNKKPEPADASLYRGRTISGQGYLTTTPKVPVLSNINHSSLRRGDRKASSPGTSHIDRLISSEDVCASTRDDSRTNSATKASTPSCRQTSDSTCSDEHHFVDANEITAQQDTIESSSSTMMHLSNPTSTSLRARMIALMKQEKNEVVEQHVILNVILLWTFHYTRRPYGERSIELMQPLDTLYHCIAALPDAPNQSLSRLAASPTVHVHEIAKEYLGELPIANDLDELTFSAINNTWKVFTVIGKWF
jgi:hypothetical protein